mmetsp:Transcript_1039/g.2484  ORF Transcript_1039/g.2484 Transcript_1039/m.2484 type:complete len:81 (-) Transcript_1039:8-250(-)
MGSTCKCNLVVVLGRTSGGGSMVVFVFGDEDATDGVRNDDTGVACRDKRRRMTYAFIVGDDSTVIEGWMIVIINERILSI